MYEVNFVEQDSTPDVGHHWGVWLRLSPKIVNGAAEWPTVAHRSAPVHLLGGQATAPDKHAQPDRFERTRRTDVDDYLAELEASDFGSEKLRKETNFRKLHTSRKLTV